MSNLPEFLTIKLEQQYGKEITNKIIEGYQNKKTSFRVNTSKSTKEEIEEFLKQENIKYTKVNWYEDAYIMEEADEKYLEQTPIYKQRKIYLQNPSSMIPPLVLDPKEKESILDMTASPGSKTTQIANLSNNNALITAVEKNKIRAERLKYNIEEQGAKKISIMIEDARHLNDFFSFEKILLDAPCSGSGTLNKNNEQTSKYFTEKLLENSVKTQKELLKKAIKLVKPNGIIIYSTCSILKEENEEVLKEVLKEGNVELLPIELSKDLPLLPVTLENTLCICPTEIHEGFFVAKLKRKK